MLRYSKIEYVGRAADCIWNEAGWTDSSGNYVAAIRDCRGILRATFTKSKPTSGGLGIVIGNGILRPLNQSKSYQNLTAYYPSGLPFADWQGDDNYLFCGQATIVANLRP